MCDICVLKQDWIRGAGLHVASGYCDVENLTLWDGVERVHVDDGWVVDFGHHDNDGIGNTNVKVTHGQGNV